MRWGQGLGVALALASIGVVVSGLFGEHGLTHLLRLRAEKRALGHAAFSRLETNERLRMEIRRLRTDDAYLEALARRQLGLVRPGEIVYRLKRPADRE